MKTPIYANQFQLGNHYTFLRPNDQLEVSGIVLGVNIRSLSGNLALTDVRIQGYGWISLSEWAIKGETE
jgi:hypothetical protein